MEDFVITVSMPNGGEKHVWSSEIKDWADQTCSDKGAKSSLFSDLADALKDILNRRKVRK